MSNEKCGPCSELDHDNCPWAAGMCPVCGPTGCLTNKITVTRPELSMDPKDSVANSMAIGRWNQQREEGLRELLSYCRMHANEWGDSTFSAGKRAAYDDVAEKLAPLLDGES